MKMYYIRKIYNKLSVVYWKLIIRSIVPEFLCLIKYLVQKTDDRFWKKKEQNDKAVYFT